MRRDALICILSLVVAAAAYLQFDPHSPFALVHTGRDPGWDTSGLHRQHAREEFEYMLEHERLSPEERDRGLQMIEDVR